MSTQVYGRPAALLDPPTHYCGGCGHGIVHRLLAEIIDEQDLRPRCIGVAPVGCAVLAYNYIDIDWSEAAHGRTPAVATGLKNVHPDHIVFSYQGDGDLASIGTAEIIHVANRGTPISVIFINNAVYGMTGGQMAPTTMLGQKTATSPRGREKMVHGCPIQVCELLSTLENAVYLERTSVTSPAGVRKTKRAIEKAFRCQQEKRGFSLVEVLSPCPTYWRMDPVDAMTYIDDVMSEAFPLGVFRDWEKDG